MENYSLLLCLQIERHWSLNALQQELTLEKLQLVATTSVYPHYKVRWLKWWNSSVHMRQAVRFPLKPVNEERLNSFIVRAAWWAGVSDICLNFVSFY